MRPRKNIALYCWDDDMGSRLVMSINLRLHGKAIRTLTIPEMVVDLVVIVWDPAEYLTVRKITDFCNQLCIPVLLYVQSGAVPLDLSPSRVQMGGEFIELLDAIQTLAFRKRGPSKRRKCAA
jgi:hypothetical protein